MYLLYYGIEPHEKLELCGPMMRNSYILHYIISGCGWFCDGKTKYNIKPGDIFAIYPDDVVSYQADENDPWYYCFVAFSGKKAEECYEKIGVSRSVPVRAVNNNDFMRTIIDCIDYADKNQNKLSQLRLTGYLYEALSCLEKDGGKTSELSSAKSCINAAILYMDCNFDKKISVADIAKYVGFEYSYFYRIFKRETGINPEQYLINLRIEKAKKLIKNGYSFKEIPNIVGIGNIYYFAKLFKQTVKMTPSEYRDKVISDKKDKQI